MQMRLRPFLTMTALVLSAAALWPASSAQAQAASQGPSVAPTRASPPSTAASAARPAAVAPSTLERIRQTRTILVGYRDASVPFSYLDADKRPIGYSIELCERIVQNLRKEWRLPDLTINWVMVKSSERIPSLLDGKIDLECGNTTATAERRRQVDFSVPTFIAGGGVLVRADLGATTLTDLRGKKVVVTTGTTGEKIINRANETGRNLVPVRVGSNSDAFAALVARQADAWITDDILLAAFRAQHTSPKDFVLLDKRHTIEPLALMYRKDDVTFTREVDRELRALIQSGEVRRMYERWFLSPIAPKGINLEVPASRFLRETWGVPTKVDADTDVIFF